MGDEALPLTVIRVDEAHGFALCQDDFGKRSSVETALVGAVVASDLLLVHAGTAIARLSPSRVSA